MLQHWLVFNGREGGALAVHWRAHDSQNKPQAVCEDLHVQACVPEQAVAQLQLQPRKQNGIKITPYSVVH